MFANKIYVYLIALSTIFVTSQSFADDCDMAKEWFNKGNQLSDYSEREAFYYNKAIKLCPEYMPPYIKLSDNLGYNKRYPEAIKIAKKALSIDPYDPTLHYLVGLGYDKEKKFAKAIKYYRKALEYSQSEKSNDRKIDILHAISGVYYSQEEYGKFYKELLDIINKYASSRMIYNTYNNISWYLSICTDDKYNHGEEAINYALKAVELSPDENWHIYGTLAAAYARNKDYKKAITSQEKAISLIKKSDLETKDKQEELKGAHEFLELFKGGRAYQEKKIVCVKK